MVTNLHSFCIVCIRTVPRGRGVDGGIEMNDHSVNDKFLISFIESLRSSNL